MSLLAWLRADLRGRRDLVGMEFACLLGGSVLCLAMSYGADRSSRTDLAVVAFSVVAVVVRGRTNRLPAEVFAAATIAPIWFVVARPGAPMEGAFFISVLMVLSVASVEQSVVRPALIATVGATYPFLVNVALNPEDIGWIAWMMAHLFTFVLGRVIRHLSETIIELDAARAELAVQAVADERRRIARELHDIAGHTLGAVMLHVTGARHVLRRDPDEAERALREAEAVGRRSLDQIRQTVSALRTSELGTDAALGSGADLVALVDEYRCAGLRIDASISDAVALDDLPGTPGVAVHRIVREALANVARHAPENRVDLRVDVGERAIDVVVRDCGRRPPPGRDSSTHYGIQGMRERARALGGSLDAAPTDDGFEVVAYLPLEVPAP